MHYDAVGRVLSVSGDSSLTGTMSYSGLGLLASATERKWVKGLNTFLTNSIEQFDALGNRYTRNDAGVTSTNTYEPATGRQLSSSSNAAFGLIEGFVYDSAGNNHITRRNSSVLDRIHNYYSADNRLVVVDRQTCAMAQGATACDAGFPDPGVGNRPVYEEYWYDALGRRIYTRSRQDGSAYCKSGWGCESTVRRAIWDGDQLLGELRYPASSPDQDVGSVTGYPGHYGRVLYTHVSGIDHPLSLTRMDYGSTVLPSSAKVYLHPDWHGNYEYGTDASGQLYDDCATARANDCVLIQWPGRTASVWGETKYSASTDKTWFGSLLDGNVERTGQTYMRNRYYDAKAGRFTQEDPIGLAGGLNSYGYANGDPVSYSDPFGLKVTYTAELKATVLDLWKHSATFRKLYNALNGADPDQINLLIRHRATGDPGVGSYTHRNRRSHGRAEGVIVLNEGVEGNLAHEIIHAAGAYADQIYKQTGVGGICGEDDEVPGNRACREPVEDQINKELAKAKADEAAKKKQPANTGNNP